MRTREERLQRRNDKKADETDPEPEVESVVAEGDAVVELSQDEEQFWNGEG